MPNLIENIARGARDSLAGNPLASNAQQDARGAELVKQLATGGLAVGGGAGALVALINYMKSLKEENELNEESRLNDDTLYIPAPQQKMAAEGGGVNRWVAPGLAMTGGLLSAGGAYALTQAIYNHLEKKRRQKMLDSAQGEALAAADLETEKSAADAKMNFYDLVTAFPVAIPLLASLAAGGVSYAALNKTFPTVQRPKSRYPKRIRQVAQTGEMSDYPEEEEALKSASIAEIRSDADCEDAATEFLVMLVDQMAMEKKAEFSLTSDLVNRTAKEGLSGVLSTYQDAGLEGLVEVVKGASDEPADMPNKTLAAAALCKSARLRPVVATLASAEFQEMAPAVYAAGLEHGPEHLEKMAGMASLLHLAFFRPQMLDKSAATNPLMQELQNMIDVPGVEQYTNPEAMEEALTTDAGGPLAEQSAEGETDEEMTGVPDDELNANPDDPIDSFMEMEGKSPLLEPVPGDMQ